MTLSVGTLVFIAPVGGDAEGRGGGTGGILRYEHIQRARSCLLQAVRYKVHKVLKVQRVLRALE